MKFVVPRSIMMLTDPVRQPAVEERLVGGPPLGQAEVAFALQGFERAHQHGLAARSAAHLEEGVERGQGSRAEAAIGNQIGIVAAIIYLTY